MRLVFLAVAVSLSACASVRAKSDTGVPYTCVPDRATDRGPFAEKPAPGTKLVVKDEDSDVKVAEH
ncbi:MAG TPA: hypothetical protein VIV60_37340 [Polyangiaceae bacterium]